MGTGESPIRVAVVDDHEMVREGLRVTLEITPDMEVVGEAGTVRRAIPMLRELRPDVALIDIQLPDGSGLDICRAVAGDPSGVRCLILTSMSHDEALLEAVAAGASGFVLKQIRGTELLTCIRKVAAGESLLDRRSADRLRERAARGDVDPLFASLTEQERRLLDLMAHGLSNREIAAEMFLAEKTVKNYVSNVLSKLGMTRRSEAAAYGARAEQRRLALGPGPDRDPIRF